MPLYSYKCEEGHEKEIFCHADDKGCQTVLCRQCQSSMASVISYGQGLLYFEEGRARRIWNLERSDQKDAAGQPIASRPVYVKSAEEHKRLMRQQGVDFANRGRGFSGQWI